MSANPAAPNGPLAIEFDRSGSDLVVHVVGEIDEITVEALTAPLMSRTDLHAEVLWLDLSEVTFCGSVGLAAFVALDRHLAATGGRLVLYRPRTIVRRALEITKVDEVLHIDELRTLESVPSDLPGASISA